MPNYVKNNPTANILINSMRSIGYSFEAAIADVIDNSISANAKNIQLYFPLNDKHCFVAICDDGNGMNKDELFNAMRYGSSNCKSKRNETDLGRFGLGLKCASLSQCKKLTVISKRDNNLNAFAWDLDYIEKNNLTDWNVAEFSTYEIENLLPKYPFVNWFDNLKSGTIVLWEDFDVLEKSEVNVYNALFSYMDSIDNYISLIYHRFLSNKYDKNSKTTNIFINDNKVKPLDPFLINHTKTHIGRDTSLLIDGSDNQKHSVYIAPFILPLSKDLSTQDKKALGGIEDYRNKQGFYIYRNKRLIVWGTWFGKRKDELSKHARILVDIPNSLDDIWGIDIKKQSATMPLKITNQLKQAVDTAKQQSDDKESFTGRKNNLNKDIDYIWDRIECRDNIFTYKINRKSLIIKDLMESLNEDTWNKVESVFDEIEANIPYQQIYLDKGHNELNLEEDNERISEVFIKASIFIERALNINPSLNKEEFINTIFKSEPFIKYKDLKNKLLKEFEK